MLKRQLPLVKFAQQFGAVKVVDPKRFTYDVSKRIWHSLQFGNVSISDNVLYYTILSYIMVKSTAWDNRAHTIIASVSQLSLNETCFRRSFRLLVDKTTNVSQLLE